VADRPDAVSEHTARLVCSIHTPQAQGKDWPFDDRWRTEAVIGLALGIRGEQAFDRMPILADALEEAGCDDRVILDHCRACQTHVMGCWVVETVLDYECRQPVLRRPPEKGTRLGRLWKGFQMEMRVRRLTPTEKLLLPLVEPERLVVRNGCTAAMVIALLVFCLVVILSRGL
jgi:hypothetical protein